MNSMNFSLLVLLKFRKKLIKLITKNTFAAWAAIIQQWLRKKTVCMDTNRKK